jgi:hypothetical protein
MNTTPDELTPELQSLAQRLAGLPFPGPDAAARSRMHVAFERALTAPRPPWWAHRLYVGAIIAALGLGLGAAGAASRSPVDVVRDPGGVVHDIVRNVRGDEQQPGILLCDDDHDDGRDGDDSSGPGSGEDDDRNDDCDDDDISGPGSGNGDDGRDDNSGPGSGEDGGRDDDSSGPGSGDHDDGLDDDGSSGPGSGDDDDGLEDDGSSGPGSGDDDDGFDDDGSSRAGDHDDDGGSEVNG